MYHLYKYNGFCIYIYIQREKERVNIHCPLCHKEIKVIISI